MMRRAKIYMFEEFAGFLCETEVTSYTFTYYESYLNNPKNRAISLTLPLRSEAYSSPYLFPFFDGLIPEGWLLEISLKNWKLNPRDRMGLLLKTCGDCIGAVKVIEDDTI
jgi:serine/threonine-protein kinase HipA